MAVASCLVRGSRCGCTCGIAAAPVLSNVGQIDQPCQGPAAACQRRQASTLALTLALSQRERGLSLLPSPFGRGVGGEGWRGLQPAGDLQKGCCKLVPLCA